MNLLNKLFAIIIIACFPLHLISQKNLLLNGNLEKHNSNGKFINWLVCSGTPDFYMSNNNSCFALFMNDEFVSEAMQGTLIYPMKVGKYYKIEADVKADAKWCKTMISEISIGFTKDSFKKIKKNVAIKLKGISYASLFSEDSSVIHSQKYEHVSGIYQAQGGEKYIIVGNIFPANINIYMNNVKSHSMYFFDNIKISQLDKPSIKRHKNQKNLNLFFTKKSHTLNPENRQLLKTWLSNIGLSSIKRIEIYGYASSEGKEAFNLTLSLKRAAEIQKYLCNYIGEDLISFKAMGEISNKKVNKKDRKVLIKAFLN
ncbi:MAG: hypothetical protein B6I20_02085 [Bacteroidetes bacterium 4572_117]|nr:MAG: hypothetical protein B6I20_02085 [Bacteroidetes bacterium 4572_117]